MRIALMNKILEYNNWKGDGTGGIDEINLMGISEVKKTQTGSIVLNNNYTCCFLEWMWENVCRR